MIEAGQVHVFNGLPSTDTECECTFALCSQSEAEAAELVYHPNAMQYSGEGNWICLECGERTGEAGEA